MIVADGRVIDSIKWEFWEWPQAIGLNGLLDVTYLLTFDRPWTDG